MLSKIIRLPLRLVPDRARVRVLSGPLRGSRWIAGASTHGAWLGTYERVAQRAFVDHVRSGGVVFDIGANVGFFTLLASKLVGKRGTVVAFEPLPRNLAILREHVQMNGCANVSVLALAVSDRSGEARLRVAADPAMSGIADDGELAVRTESVDGMLAEGRLPPPAFMKIDVEGGEADVLSGALRTLRAHRPRILLSTHGYAIHERCCALLEREGYRLDLLIDGEVDGNYMLLAQWA